MGDFKNKANSSEVVVRRFRLMKTFIGSPLNPGNLDSKVNAWLAKATDEDGIVVDDIIVSTSNSFIVVSVLYIKVSANY